MGREVSIDLRVAEFLAQKALQHLDCQHRIGAHAARVRLRAGERELLILCSVSPIGIGIRVLRRTDPLPHLAAAGNIIGAVFLGTCHFPVSFPNEAFAPILCARGRNVPRLPPGSGIFPISRRKKENIKNRTGCVDFFHLSW